MSALAQGQREFTVPEVSAILGLPVKEINNAVARTLRPLGVARQSGGSLSVTGKGVFALAMLKAISKWFVPDVRQKLLKQALSASTDENVSVEKGCVMVNIAEYREQANQGANRLRSAEALVSSNPEIMNGEPCIRGTRVPVYLVGSLARKHGVEKARSAYPSLSAEQVELVALYVKANPRRGRPPQSGLPEAKGPAKKGRGKKIRI